VHITAKAIVLLAVCVCVCGVCEK